MILILNHLYLGDLILILNHQHMMILPISEYIHYNRCHLLKKISIAMQMLFRGNIIALYNALHHSYIFLCMQKVYIHILDMYMYVYKYM